MRRETAIGGGRSGFPTTRWTMVLATRRPQDAAPALQQLLETYWKPLYFFARKRGLSVEESKDAVQDFVVQVLERDIPASADPAKGRFRSFLRTALANFLANREASRTARKRGGGAIPLSLDFEGAEIELASQPDAPDAAFDREWACAVMERGLQRLEREFAAGRRSGPFELARRFFQPHGAPTHEEAAREAAMSASAWKAFLHRTRVRFRELVREEIAETVDGESEIDGELALLVRALS